MRHSKQAELLQFLLAPFVAHWMEGAALLSCGRLLAALIGAQRAGRTDGKWAPPELNILNALDAERVHVLHVLGIERAPGVREAMRWLVAAREGDLSRLQRFNMPRVPRCRCCGQWLPGAAS